MEILERGSYSHIVLQQVLEKYQYLDKRQRSFITRVVQGTVERKIEMDAVLDAVSATPVKKMKPVIRTILRFSVYQIMYLDGVRDAAVCDEAVKLAKKRGFYQLRGFVNGVLRSVCRQAGQLEFHDLSTRYSVPQWLIDLWRQEYDDKTIEQMLMAFLAPAPTTIRVNTDRISVEELKERLGKKGILVKEHPRLPYALVIDQFDHLKGMEEFSSGLFYVQDVSSMMVAQEAGLKLGDYVIDVCGAPGGKSLHAASLLAGTGMVECRDLSEEKVSLIRQNISRSGRNNIRAVKMDATLYDEASRQKADVLFCDLPCSGLGIIGKKPDIKYHMTPEKIASLVLLQRQILGVCASYVKDQGTMVYSTCTIDRQENQDNVTWFLGGHPEFSCVKMEQMLPVEGEQDGFFYAVLKKNEIEGSVSGNEE